MRNLKGIETLCTRLVRMCLLFFGWDFILFVFYLSLVASNLRFVRLGSRIMWGLAWGWGQFTHPSLHKDRGILQPEP